MKVWKKKLIIVGIEVFKVIVKYVVPVLAGYLEGSEHIIESMLS